MARYTGPRLQRCRREKVKLFLKGAKCDAEAHRDPPVPARASTAAVAPSRASTSSRCARSRRRRIYGVLEKQFRGYYEEANRKQGKTGKNLLGILETPHRQRLFPRRLRQQPRQGPSAGAPRPHHRERPQGRTSCSYRVSENDIIWARRDPRSTSRPSWSRAPEVGERTVPAWIEVTPNKMRILAHSLPACR